MLFFFLGDLLNVEVFDIILLYLLFCNVCYFMVFFIGWYEMFLYDDDSFEVNIVWIKCYRNDLFYCVFIEILNGEFEDIWIKIFLVIVVFEGSVLRKKIEVLKIDFIDCKI